MRKMGKLIWLVAMLFLVLMEGRCCEGCWKKESDRLLDFKARFSNPDSELLRNPQPEPLMNWVDGTDCCLWEGVECSNTTRRVVKLTLDGVWEKKGARYLNLSDFLVFEDLKALDLSYNFIDGIVGNEGMYRLSCSILQIIPFHFQDEKEPFIYVLQLFTLAGFERRRFSNLEVLDLSFNRLNDTSINILSGFSGFSFLRSLNLSNNDFTVKSFHSLERLSSNLSNLEVLEVSYNLLTNDILPCLRKFSSLKSLYLSGTGLDSDLHIPGLLSKLINLEVLDMSDNNFNQSDILSSLSGLSSLKSLILKFCRMTRRSISSLSKLHSLEILDLTGNHLNISFGTLSTQDNGGISWPTSLEVLELRENSFSNDILSSLGALQRLKSLNLGHNNLEGSLDITGLNALSNLETLDIGGNNIDSFVIHQGTKWLSSLKVLILDGMNIDANMLQKLLKAFSSIRMLNLKDNNFKGTVAAQDFGELSNLEQLVLDASSNLLNEFFKSIGALTSLKVLSLQNCNINGSLPAADWSNLKKLEVLDLGNNKFEGPLPSSFGNMISLRTLDLSFNQFTGNLAPNLAGLTSLESLDFSKNQFQVPASFSFFANHSHLKFIHGDGNNVILDPHPTSKTWVPKFQLQELSLCATTQNGSIPFPNFLLYQNKLTIVDLTGCKFEGEFPNWLLENNTEMIHLILRNNFFTGYLQLPSHPIPNIQSIDVSDNAITGHIPGNNISSIFPRLHFLDMSGNAISGSLPYDLGQMMSLITLDLSDNNLSGEIPKNISAGRSLIKMLKLSNNKLSGPISPLLALHHLSYLLLDGNNLSGTITNSFSNASLLSHVDLSNNHFVGKLPRLLGNSTNLRELSMSNNHLEGSIPEELGSLFSLDLSGNNLSGSVPSFNNSSLSTILLSDNMLSGLTTVMFSSQPSFVSILDLSNNDISGTIQDIIGNIDDMNILLLKGNRIRGQIPNKLCNLTLVTILDFSHNSLSGPIPKCLGEIPFSPGPGNLIEFTISQSIGVYPPPIVQHQVNFTTKSSTYRYEGNIINYMTGMDLSHNKLHGDIPPELGNMTGIRAINLSHNYLTGPIPSTFSNLKQIESLDLSFNKLSSEIPPQLTQLTSLEVFSVAHNHLSGTTPDRKGQFITFDESSYEGNPFLCGPPLQSCVDYSGQTSTLSPNADRDTDGGLVDMDVFYISMAVSYTMVLLVMVAVLYINPYWRRAWFYFIEFVITTCYNFFIDHFPKLY